MKQKQMIYDRRPVACLLASKQASVPMKCFPQFFSSVLRCEFREAACLVGLNSSHDHYRRDGIPDVECGGRNGGLGERDGEREGRGDGRERGWRLGGRWKVGGERGGKG